MPALVKLRPPALAGSWATVHVAPPSTVRSSSPVSPIEISTSSALAGLTATAWMTGSRLLGQSPVQAGRVSSPNDCPPSVDLKSRPDVCCGPAPPPVPA